LDDFQYSNLVKAPCTSNSERASECRLMKDTNNGFVLSKAGKSFLCSCVVSRENSYCSTGAVGNLKPVKRADERCVSLNPEKFKEKEKSHVWTDCSEEGWSFYCALTIYNGEYSISHETAKPCVKPQ